MKTKENADELKIANDEFKINAELSKQIKDFIKI